MLIDFLRIVTLQMYIVQPFPAVYIIGVWGWVDQGGSVDPAITGTRRPKARQERKNRPRRTKVLRNLFLVPV